jgi:hypothetical protein
MGRRLSGRFSGAPRGENRRGQRGVYKGDTVGDGVCRQDGVGGTSWVQAADRIH